MSTIEKLEQLKQYIQATGDSNICGKMDSALDEISQMDFFGTEGQLDPRGDQRDAPWNPYDPNDEDSEGEYEYFRCESPQMAVNCIDELIKLYNEVDVDYQNETSKMFEDAFSNIFKEYGLE